MKYTAFPNDYEGLRCYNAAPSLKAVGQGIVDPKQTKFITLTIAFLFVAGLVHQLVNVPDIAKGPPRVCATHINFTFETTLSPGMQIIAKESIQSVIHKRHPRLHLDPRNVRFDEKQNIVYAVFEGTCDDRYETRMRTLRVDLLANLENVQSWSQSTDAYYPAAQNLREFHATGFRSRKLPDR